MSTYLAIRGNNTSRSYECKTTHTGTPYLKVNSNAYLDLTTNTINGIQIKIKQNGSVYRPLQSTTTTATRSSEYTETTGYSGISSRTSTSGYSGYSITSITSSTKSGRPTVYLIPAISSSSSYSTSYGVSTSFSKYTITSSTLTANEQTTLFKETYSTFTQYSSIANYSVTYRYAGTSSKAWQSSVTNGGGGRYSSATAVFIQRGGDYNAYPDDQQLTTTHTFANSYYRYSTVWYTLNSTAQTAIGMYGSRAPSMGAASYIKYSRTVSNAQRSYYTGSTVHYAVTTVMNSAGLISTTALTRSSAYNITSITTNAGISSTTALTQTNSRSSQYNTQTEI